MHGGWRGITRPDAFDDRRARFLDYTVARRLLGYVRPYRGLVAISLVTMLLYTFTVVATPWLVLLAIDRIVESKSLSGLSFIVILLFANVAVNYVTQYIHLITMARVSQNVLLDLRNSLFSHLQRLSMSFYDKEQMGRVMSRLQNDVHQLQEFLSHLAVVLGDFLTLVGIVIAMLFIEWSLALITLSVTPVLVILALIWQRYSWPRFMQVRRALATVNGNLQENISGMRVIQSLNREDQNFRSFDGLNHNHLGASLTASRLSASLLPPVEILTAISMGLIIIFGGLMVINGNLTVGVVVAFALYIQRYFEPIRNLTMHYAQIQRAMTSGSHIFELMDIQPEIEDKPEAVEIPPIRGEVVFEDVKFHYTPAAEVLKGLNLCIKPGETLAIVGPTGAGKTTLASLVLRLYDVTGGRITIDGQDIRDVKRTSLANQIGTVLQEPFLFSGTIMDNISFCHPKVTREEVIKAAKMVGADDFISLRDGGYEAEVEEGGGNLSGGQRQLIALARALVFDPRIIILDEATASVDSYTEMLIQQALSEVLKDRTALIIAHRLSTVRNADRIIVVDQGCIVEEGTHQRLLEARGFYAKLYWMNFSGNGAAPSSVRDGDGKAPTST